MLGDHGCSITRRVSTPLACLFAKAGITPNQITVTGTLLSVGIAIPTLSFRHVWQGALTLALVLSADSVNGISARATNGGTRFGTFPGLAPDHIVGGAVFVSLTAWTIFPLPEGLPRTLAIEFGLAVIIGVGTVPCARARAESIGAEAELGITERTDRLLTAILSAVFVDSGWGAWWLVIGFGQVAFASFIIVIQRITFIARTVKEEIQA